MAMTNCYCHCDDAHDDDGDDDGDVAVASAADCYCCRYCDDDFDAAVSWAFVAADVNVAVADLAYYVADRDCYSVAAAAVVAAAVVGTSFAAGICEEIKIWIF